MTSKKPASSYHKSNMNQDLSTLSIKFDKKKLNLILQEYPKWKKNFDNEIAKSVHHSFWDHPAFSHFGEYLYEEWDNVQGKDKISTTYKFLSDNGIAIRPAGYEFYTVEEEITKKRESEPYMRFPYKNQSGKH